MRYQFYREHKYVSAALNDLERLIARADFCDSAALDRVKSEFGSLAAMLKGHAQYENERLHLLLKQKSVPSCIYAHIEEDHAVQERQLGEIEKRLQDISLESDAERKIERGYQLYLIYRKFVADNLAHLHEEETQILPELQKYYSDTELQQVEAKTYREMNPEDMIHMIEVLFPHMNPHDQKAFFADIQFLEPEKYKVVLNHFQFKFSAGPR